MKVSERESFKSRRAERCSPLDGGRPFPSIRRFLPSSIFSSSFRTEPGTGRSPAPWPSVNPRILRVMLTGLSHVKRPLNSLREPHTTAADFRSPACGTGFACAPLGTFGPAFLTPRGGGRADCRPGTGRFLGAPASGWAPARARSASPPGCMSWAVHSVAQANAMTSWRYPQVPQTEPEDSRHRV